MIKRLLLRSEEKKRAGPKTLRAGPRNGQTLGANAARTTDAGMGGRHGYKAWVDVGGRDRYKGGVLARTI